MSYNIFIDLGFDADEAVDLLNRSNAMQILTKFILQHGSSSAGLLGIQPKVVEDIVLGRIDRLSLKRLNKLLIKISSPQPSQFTEQQNEQKEQL